MDEPFTSLDSKSIAFLTALMEKHRAKEGRSIVFTSHQASSLMFSELKNIFLDGKPIK